VTIDAMIQHELVMKVPAAEAKKAGVASEDTLLVIPGPQSFIVVVFGS